MQPVQKYWKSKSVRQIHASGKQVSQQMKVDEKLVTMTRCEYYIFTVWNHLWRMTNFLPATNLTCLSPYGTLDENSHMNVTLNISSQGKTCDFLFINHSWVQSSLKSIFFNKCKMFSLISGQCKTYSFNITNNRDQCEVRMNETFAGIKLWIFPNDDCLAPFESNQLGACHPTRDTTTLTHTT